MESVRMKMDDQKKHDYSELVERLEDRATCMEVLSPNFAAACRDAAAAIAKLAVERDELHTYAFEATKTITSMTVGGSEFFGKRIGEMYTADLPYCVEHIMERECRAHERWLREWRRNGKLSSQLEKAEAEVERLTKELETLRLSASAWEDSARMAVERAWGAEAEIEKLKAELEVQRECKEHARRMCDRAEASAAVKVKALEAAGSKLANCAYNISQRGEISERERVFLREAQAEWDAALTTEPAAPQEAAAVTTTWTQVLDHLADREVLQERVKVIREIAEHLRYRTSPPAQVG